MFFSELAMWLAIALPSYSLENEKTADIVHHRILYCKYVLTHVLVYRSDSKEENPQDRLPYIISELESIHSYLCDAYQKAAINKQMHLAANTV